MPACAVKASVDINMHPACSCQAVFSELIWPRGIAGPLHFHIRPLALYRFLLEAIMGKWREISMSDFIDFDSVKTRIKQLRLCADSVE